MKKTDAIILAGGLGTRLRSVVTDRPKVLAPVNDKPFLDIILNFLTHFKRIDHVVLSLGYMAGKKVEEYEHRNIYPYNISFSIEEKPLGTGGGIKKALSLAKTESVLVLNGDSFVDVNIDELFRFHMDHRAALTMTIVEMDDACRFGRVVLGEDGRIIAFLEKESNKDESGYINAGVYVLERILFDAIDADVPLSLERDLMPSFLTKGIYGFPTKKEFIDMGTPESYRKANQLFR